MDSQSNDCSEYGDGSITFSTGREVTAQPATYSYSPERISLSNFNSHPDPQGWKEAPPALHGAPLARQSYYTAPPAPPPYHPSNAVRHDTAMAGAAAAAGLSSRGRGVTAPASNSRFDSSLGLLTRKFTNLIHASIRFVLVSGSITYFRIDFDPSGFLLMLTISTALLHV